MQEDDLLRLLEESKAWNTTHGVTGMLLYITGEIAQYKQGRFIQALEGTEEEIRSLFEKIQHDPRHHDIILLNEGPIFQRNFETWLMGFKSMSLQDYKKFPGYFDLNDKFLRTARQKQLNVPLTYLKNFYSMSLNKSIH